MCYINSHYIRFSDPDFLEEINNIALDYIFDCFFHCMDKIYPVLVYLT